jgi:probable HAF family extracellular repeat protein
MALLSKPTGSSTQANAVNDTGTVVGFTLKSSGITRATVWSGGSRSELPDLAGGADYSNALAINANGLVVGSSGVAGGGHAFAWTAAGGMLDLGDLAGGDVASAAYGVNDDGDIVGTGSSAAQAQHALLWRGGQTIDLGALPAVQAAGWTLAQATDINNQGQITGWGWVGGQQHGFVLSPVAAPVPEPAAWLLLAAGGLTLLAWRRRPAVCRVAAS